MKTKLILLLFYYLLFNGIFMTTTINSTYGSPKSSYPRLMANTDDIARAKKWIKKYSWYRQIFEEHKAEINRFIQHRPIYVSPIKQTYQYKMYTCPQHDVELIYDEFSPHEHRCPADSTEVYRGEKYDAAWAGWYNERLAKHLVWMGLLYQVYGDEKYAEAAREILVAFADLYLDYPTENTILGPAHVFFGTLSESFWGVNMSYGYDLVYNYKGFTRKDRKHLKEQLFYPLAKITQQFPESASNRQLWYNNVSAAVGFLYEDQELIDFALKGEYGFEWQLGSALPESGFWAEGPGYHFVALRGMIHLAEMARHNGMDLYHWEIAGRSMKKMFDAPFDWIKPNYEFPRIKDSGGGNILEYATFYEVGYAVYKDPKYLALLNLTHIQRGTQVVGQDSGLGVQREPLTLFNLEPELPEQRMEIYPEKSVNIKGNGFSILRNGSGKDRRYLYLDYGIMGGEHGHPDRLQMGYYALGRNWIVDPLNESYFNPNLQTWYRQSIAHNTLVLDQTTQTWTNGYGIFFGTLPAIQIAAGGSETMYPGAKLIRTLIQIGDYFVDLCDVECGEPRIVDYPIHSFDRLTIEGVDFKKQPIDRFGHQPGIPGYDQLTEIYSGKTDDDWNAFFGTAEGECLLVLAIGEDGTEVFKAMTPPIGGFYKQMVKNQRPLPMFFSRRMTDKTRFAHLFQAFRDSLFVIHFEKSDTPNHYLVFRTNGVDEIQTDLENSIYYVLRKEQDQPTLLAGFGLTEVVSNEIQILNAQIALKQFECHWKKDKLSITTVDDFGRVKIFAPQINKIELNDRLFPFERDGDYVILTQDSGIAINLIAPTDSLLFQGIQNKLLVQVSNYTDQAITDQIKFRLAANWQEQVESQLDWWGGIVNLKATNKIPPLKKLFPEAYRKDVRWIDGMSAESKTIQAGKSEIFEISLPIPNDAPPVNFPVQIEFGNQSIQTTLAVKPPISVDLIVPNATKEMLLIKLSNLTYQNLKVSTQLILNSAWQVLGNLTNEIDLPARKTATIKVPIQFIGYNPDEQLYPIRLILKSENFHTEIIRDFYVGVAYFAVTPPSLEGDWQGWNRANPMTIDKPNQVCKLLMGNQPWKGTDDLSAKIYAMYDDTYLYIGAEVIDDTVIEHWDFPRMSYPWDTDCMEVVIDTRTNSAQGSDPPTPGLFRQLCMPEYRTTDFGAKAWLGGAAGGPLLPKPNLVQGSETYFTKTDQGYNIICRFPLLSLRDIIAEPGCKIGFDVAINDNDGTNYRKNMHIWAGFTQNQSWWDMGTIGALIFGKK